MDKLALLGGEPISEKVLNYGKQYIDNEDIKEVERVLRSPFLTCGPEITQLENKLCNITGAAYAVCVSNGTAALHIACLAAGISRGDEVIVSSITFAASANCVLYCGATPVFADIDSLTWNISPSDIRRKITNKTKAVIAVDFSGQAVELDEIRFICKEHQLTLIEDAAHSIGTQYNGKAVGSIADMTTFSFHPVKTVTGGEGGAVLTNDKALYKKLSLFRAHGITRDPSEWQHCSNGIIYHEQIELGFNYRITDFQAALISSQLNKLPLFSRRRKEIVQQYNQAFANTSGISIQKEIVKSDSTRHLYILRFKLDLFNATRKQIYDALYAENICCNIHYMPVYYHPYYAKLGYTRGLCPYAEQLYEEILSLPLYYGMTDEDVSNVIYAVRKVIQHYKKDV